MRTLMATLLAATLVVAFPTTAGAEGHGWSDGGGDVWKHQGTSTQDSSHTDGDILLTQIQHRKRVIRMFITVDTLDADGGSSVRPTIFRFVLINGRGLTKVFDLNDANALRVRKLTDGKFSPSSCRWTRHAVNEAAGRVAVTIPRSCMRRPKFVRMQATVYDSDSSGIRYVDDAYTAYDSTLPEVEPGSSPWLKKGPKNG